jgi:hypothetical protein
MKTNDIYLREYSLHALRACITGAQITAISWNERA